MVVEHNQIQELLLLYFWPQELVFFSTVWKWKIMSSKISIFSTVKMLLKKFFLMGSQASFVKFKAKFILKDLIKLFCFSTGKKKGQDFFFFFFGQKSLSKEPSNTYLYVI